MAKCPAMAKALHTVVKPPLCSSFMRIKQPIFYNTTDGGYVAVKKEVLTGLYIYL